MKRSVFLGRGDASLTLSSCFKLKLYWLHSPPGLIATHYTLLRRSSSADEEIESPCWSVRALVQQYEEQGAAVVDSTETGDPR